jgi:RNA-directed DNA polymerase
LAISLQSMNRAMAKVEELTPRGTNEPIEKTIAKINRWFMGWSNYFKMTEYPSQFCKIQAHARRRLRARIIYQKKNERNLYEALRKRGISKKQAARAAFASDGIWAKSHFRAVEKAYSNKWFIEEKGLKVRTDEWLPHWKDLEELARLW